MKVSRYLGSDLIKILFLKQDFVSSFLFPHSWFCIIWHYCIIFHRDHECFIKCFIEIFYCMVFQNEIFTFPEEMDSWQSHALFCVPKNFDVVCKIRKKLEFPTLQVLPSSSGHIKTDIKRIECLAIFPATICLFEFNNRKTTKRFEVV